MQIFLLKQFFSQNFHYAVIFNSIILLYNIDNKQKQNINFYFRNKNSPILKIENFNEIFNLQ